MFAGCSNCAGDGGCGRYDAVCNSSCIDGYKGADCSDGNVNTETRLYDGSHVAMGVQTVLETGRVTGKQVTVTLVVDRDSKGKFAHNHVNIASTSHVIQRLVAVDRDALGDSTDMTVREHELTYNGWYVVVRNDWYVVVRNDWYVVVRNDWYAVVRYDWYVVVRNDWYVVVRNNWYVVVRNDWYVVVRNDWYVVRVPTALTTADATTRQEGVTSDVKRVISRLPAMKLVATVQEISHVTLTRESVKPAARPDTRERSVKIPQGSDVGGSVATGQPQQSKQRRKPQWLVTRVDDVRRANNVMRLDDVDSCRHSDVTLV
ncbi:hypothetical protein Btru_013997 [Bulinus truncatus]|nr:hypothetical protein Btru_013997 [Bulinus truncatus]